jgi:RNA polymerase sigma-70 factor (ECF subfamily)
MQIIVNSFLLFISDYEIPWPLALASLPPDLEKASDEESLQLIKDGTESQCIEAFSALYNRYYRDVWRFIRSKAPNENEAKDIFGEVWLVVIEKISEFEWRGVPIKAWLFEIAERQVRASSRKRKEEREKIIPLEEERHAEALRFIDEVLRRGEASLHTDPSSEVRREADKLLHEALSGLGPKSHKIIVLSYYKGKNSTEIAEILGMKPGAVRVAKKRALEKLQTLLGNNMSFRGEK